MQRQQTDGGICARGGGSPFDNFTHCIGSYAHVPSDGIDRFAAQHQFINSLFPCHAT